jgi:hypothetical protein
MRLLFELFSGLPCVALAKQGLVRISLPFVVPRSGTKEGEDQLKFPLRDDDYPCWFSCCAPPEALISKDLVVFTGRNQKCIMEI